jgi:hypothetical protein
MGIPLMRFGQFGRSLREKGHQRDNIMIKTLKSPPDTARFNTMDLEAKDVSR